MNADPLPSTLGPARSDGLGRALRSAGLGALARLPAMLVRLLVRTRDPGVAALDDRQLADIGLTRAEVGRSDDAAPPQARAEALRHLGRWHV